jgi:hypothetical protein
MSLQSAFQKAWLASLVNPGDDEELKFALAKLAEESKTEIKALVTGWAARRDQINNARDAAGKGEPHVA